VDGIFNKEGPIENTVEINIFYQEHRKNKKRRKRKSSKIKRESN